MPRPLYIICSESTAQDSENNILSIFNVIERLTAEAVLKQNVQPASQNSSAPTQPMLVQMMSFRVTIVWMKLPEDDPKQEYQHQFVMHDPIGKESILMDAREIYFENDEQPLNRLIIKIHGPPFQKQGQYRAESRMRRADHPDDPWIRQDYPFLVSVNEISEEEFEKRSQKS